MSARTASLKTMCALLESDFLSDESLMHSDHSGKTFLSQLKELAVAIAETANAAHIHDPAPQELLCALMSGIRAFASCAVRPFHDESNTTTIVLQLALGAAMTASHDAAVRCQAWQVVEMLVAINEDMEDSLKVAQAAAPGAGENLDRMVQGAAYAASVLGRDEEESEEEAEVAQAALDVLSALSVAELDHAGAKISHKALQLCAEGLRAVALPVSTRGGLVRCVSALGAQGHHMSEVAALLLQALSQSTGSSEGVLCRRGAIDGMVSLSEHWSGLELSSAVLCETLQQEQDEKCRQMLFEAFSSFLLWKVETDIANYLPLLCHATVCALRLQKSDSPCAAKLAGVLASCMPAGALRGQLRGLAEALAPFMEPLQQQGAPEEGSDAMQCAALEAMGPVVASAATTGELQEQECRTISECALRCIGSENAVVRAAAIRCCRTICAELGEASRFVDVKRLISAVLADASTASGSVYGTHAGDTEARVASLQLISVCTIGGHQVAAECFTALLSNIAGSVPHPSSDVRREACLGLQAWWRWLAAELAARPVQLEGLVWVVPAILEGVEAVVKFEDDGTLEAAGLAGMLLECEAAKQHGPTRARLEAVNEMGLPHRSDV